MRMRDHSSRSVSSTVPARSRPAFACSTSIVPMSAATRSNDSRHARRIGHITAVVTALSAGVVALGRDPFSVRVTHVKDRDVRALGS